MNGQQPFYDKKTTITEKVTFVYSPPLDFKVCEHSGGFFFISVKPTCFVDSFVYNKYFLNQFGVASNFMLVKINILCWLKPYMMNRIVVSQT